MGQSWISKSSSTVLEYRFQLDSLIYIIDHIYIYIFNSDLHRMLLELNLPKCNCCVCRIVFVLLCLILCSVDGKS